MPIRSTTYVREDGTEARAQVVAKVNRTRRSTFRDRIARLELDLIDPDLRASFDILGAKVYARQYSEAYTVGLDLSIGPDATAIWEIEV